jgi:hypothetical protein
MTKSLKSCIQELARILGEKPDALYERVRALDREGLLKSVPGKGPGSGVRATPDAFAMLLIAAMLGSVSLIESGTRARAIAKARLGVAGETFRDAIARVLADEASAASVSAVRVAVTGGFAQIETAEGSFVFMSPHLEKGAVRIDVAISGDTVRAFANVLSGAGPNVR